jgi:serine/threonine protein kinase
MTLAPGTKLGPYEILARIGAGGMGEVWKARDTRLGRIVAIKKVKEQHSERFKQEARTIAALNHSNICQLFDIGPDYLVLEYVEGKPLSSPLPEKEAVRLGIQVAAALEAAHKKGIIHRDLKPANILVADEGSVKLLDFGLAKLYERDADTSQSPTADFPATQAGAILGTVAYMSPEQAQGHPADARSDIFSFGLVLYEMLSGRRAFSGDSTPAVMAALLRDEPPPLQASSSVDKIVRRCLAKQPSARYQTISELKTALEQVLAEKASASSTEPLLKESYVEAWAEISPDGRWMAYQSDESGKPEVYVRPFPDVNKGKSTVSTTGGTFPLWSPDRPELFYRNGDAVMVVKVETDPEFKSGKPEVLFRGKYVQSGNRATWAIGRDGRFLMMKAVENTGKAPAAESPRKINVVLNWIEELKQNVPVK